MILKMQSQPFRIIIDDVDSPSGAGLTALDHTAAGLIVAVQADNEAAPTVYTSAGSTVESITTLGTYAAPTASKCRFKKVDDTNCPGEYEIQIANARFAVAGALFVTVTVQVTGGVIVRQRFQVSAAPIADDVLDRAFVTGVDSGGVTMRNALRVLINKTLLSGGTLSVYKEDGVTLAWSATLATDAAADPIVGVTPI